MKKHLLVARLGRDEPLCGRQIARPGVGQQVAPGAVTADRDDVRCGWCLQKMQEQGQELTAGQRPLVARKSVPGPRAEAEEEEDDREGVFDDSRFP
jgi:hypothetical protein